MNGVCVCVCVCVRMRVCACVLGTPRGIENLTKVMPLRSGRRTARHEELGLQRASRVRTDAFSCEWDAPASTVERAEP